MQNHKRAFSWQVLSAALIASAVAACAFSGPRTLSDQHVTYSYSDFRRVADGRDIHVVVRGNPFALNQPEFDRLVIDGMEATIRGSQTNFTVAKSGNADPNYEVVWLFNGPLTAQPNELCKNPQAINGQSANNQSGGAAQQVRVVAAFCRFDSANSWTEGWLDGGPQGVSREGFNALVQQMTYELFPLKNRNDPQKDNCRGVLC